MFVVVFVNVELVYIVVDVIVYGEWYVVFDYVFKEVFGDFFL